MERTARIAWWQDVEPSLFANATIRNFLLHYRAQDHPQIVKLVLLQGILSLQDTYGLKPLSVPHLRCASAPFSHNRPLIASRAG